MDTEQHLAAVGELPHLPVHLPHLHVPLEGAVVPTEHAAAAAIDLALLVVDVTDPYPDADLQPVEVEISSMVRSSSGSSRSKTPSTTDGSAKS